MGCRITYKTDFENRPSSRIRHEGTAEETVMLIAQLHGTGMVEDAGANGTWPPSENDGNN